MPGPIRRLVHVLASVALLSVALVFVGTTAANAQAPPAITAISPTSGPTTGGTTVTITGTGFTGFTKVLFGVVAATDVSVVSPTEITAVSPAQAAAVHNIYVTTDYGTSAPVAADLFTYAVIPPAVTAISPTSGPTTGGTTVTITGTDLYGTTNVLFGAVPASAIKLLSSTEILAQSPAQAAAAHNIYVITPDGTSAPVAADVFTYISPPTTSVVLPANGAALSGSTNLDATASNATSVEFLLSGDTSPICTFSTVKLTLVGWACSWDTTKVLNGSYTLVSVASNAVGSTISSGVSIMVANPVPTTSMLVPANNVPTVSGTAVALAASASNAKTVEFWATPVYTIGQEHEIGTATETLCCGYVYSWDSTTVSAGVWGLFSEAINGSESATSAQVLVIVSN